MIRPVNTEVLQNICEEIAEENYGFVYLNDHRSVIKERYEQKDLSLKYKSSLSLSDLNNGMEEVAENEFNSFQRLRGDAYFLNPFNQQFGREIGDELERLLVGSPVLHKKDVESQFNIAPADVDFFVEKLVGKDLLERLEARDRDYFVGGVNMTNDTSRNVSLESQLKARSDHEGKLSHRELEEIIDVAATNNVIDHLSRNDHIIDIDGEYLVQAALDEFAESIAERIEDDVAKEFTQSDYVLDAPEFSQVVENKISEHSDILKQARSVKREILDSTEQALQERLALENTKQMFVMHSEELDGKGFEAFVETEAQNIHDQVVRSDTKITQPSDQKQAGRELITERGVGRTEKSRDFIQNKIEQRYKALVDKEWGG